MRRVSINFHNFEVVDGDVQVWCQRIDRESSEHLTGADVDRLHMALDVAREINRRRGDTMALTPDR